MKLTLLNRILFAMIAATSCVSAFARPEPNAFLNKPAHSKEALIAQLRTDPSVLKRYSTHFGMDKEQLAGSFAQFELVRLAEKKQFVVYNADKNNKISSKVFTLPKGALVYVDRSGVPVLKKSCGNALSKQIHAGVPVPTAPMITTTPRLKELQALALTPSAPEPLELMVAAEVAHPAFEPEAVFEPTDLEPDVPELFEPEVAPFAGAGPGPIGSLPLFPLVPITGVFVRESGKPGPPGTDGPSNIPGPAAVAVFALPTVFWARRRLKVTS